MVDVLIFSKDRAAQLDLLLRSIERHAPDLYSTITVLCVASSVEYEHGYDACVEEHSGVMFLGQSDFEANVRDWLRTVTTHCCSFLVDDDVFYRDAEFGNTLSEWGCYSLRGGDYDYPFSLDGNIYPTHKVIAHLGLFSFSDPTELEARAHDLRERLPWTEVAAMQPSCLVGVPANRVSLNSGMPHMGVELRMLNDAFLRGERIECVFDRDTYPAHWPVEYRLVVPA